MHITACVCACNYNIKIYFYIPDRGEDILFLILSDRMPFDIFYYLFDDTFINRLQMFCSPHKRDINAAIVQV